MTDCANSTDPGLRDAANVAGPLLAQAFAAFNASARDLEVSWQALEREGRRLRRQLRDADRDRTAAHREHVDLRNRLNALLETLPGGVLVLDGEDCVAQANRAAVALLGEPVHGKRWSDLRSRATATAGGAATELELAGGRIVAIAQRALEPGPGRVLLLNDVTESRRVTELLERHRRLATLGEMAANLAHQVRTPLAAALLYAGNAARTELPAAQRDGQLRKAIGCLQDLERLVADMLGFARGAQPVDTQFELAELVANADAALRPQLAASQQLRTAPVPRGLGIRGSRENLAGALTNLIANALQAAGPAASVRIDVVARPFEVLVNVTDNGPGIERGSRERIFDPFVTTRPDGTGLGLAVARAVARAHGGDVELTTADAGQTTFTLRLPLAGVRAPNLSATDAAA